MGNTHIFFGNIPSNGINRYLHPEITPGPYEKPTFDPMYGFENGRKERVMIATIEEMKSAKIRMKDRDYCAHKLLIYRGCYVAQFPWIVKCEHEKHVYLNCIYDDFILRMKEYERERRLRVRREKQRAVEEENKQ